MLQQKLSVWSKEGGKRSVNYFLADGKKKSALANKQLLYDKSNTGTD